MSSIHQCPRCLYVAKTKQNLRLHYSRVKPCTLAENGRDVDLSLLYEGLGPIRPKQKTRLCSFCNKMYASASSLCTHLKKCKQNTTVTILNENNCVIDKLVERLNALERQLNERQQNIHTTNVARDQINQNNIIIVNALGQENLEYLKPDFLTQCVMDVTQKGIPNFIENIHLNKDHPENHNIRGVSKRSGTMEIYNGKHWRLNPATSVLDDLIQKGCKILYRHFNSHMSSEMNPDLQDMITKNMLNLTDVTKNRKSETYYKIRQHLFCIFFEDKLDDFILVADPGNEDIIEQTLNE